METSIQAIQTLHYFFVDITSSPQGDGNAHEKGMGSSEATVDITSSPQGDGNDHTNQFVYCEFVVVDITSSPQGDGNNLVSASH